MLALPNFLPPVRPGLHIVSTPIGCLGDITLRALSVLHACDVIACEDTRISRKLLTIYGITKPLISYHDHNEDEKRLDLLERVRSGQIVALVSDAGTPLISDPGFKLVRTCLQENLPVTVVPGASAVIAGMVLSGQPTNCFLFAGFADSKEFSKWVSLDASLIFFESASRLISTLKSIQNLLPGRSVSVVRELTKVYENVQLGDPQTLIDYYTQNPAKGEIVLVLGPPTAFESINSSDIEKLLKEALKKNTLRDACTLVSGATGKPRKEIYQLALELKE